MKIESQVMGIETLKEELAFGRLMIGILYTAALGILLVYYQAFGSNDNILKLSLMGLGIIIIFMLLTIVYRYYIPRVEKLKELEDQK
ncbi:hypothetical protein BMS3Abin16_01705 [archaeon BMS3Abin16]|nr:hypothetical protein BMS3Abin16_01705 [archaeon BMS3Abin16]